MAFDYEAETEIDVLSVADAIRSDYRLAPLTDEQKVQRRIEIEAWREEQAFLAEERCIERECQQAEAEAAARHEQALALAEQNRKARLERQEAISRQTREREITDLRLQSIRHQAWQRDVEIAARNAIAYRQRETLMSELDALVSPPPPQPSPEPEVINVEQPAEETGRLDYPTLHRWF